MIKSHHCLIQCPLLKKYQLFENTLQCHLIIYSILKHLIHSFSPDIFAVFLFFYTQRALSLAYSMIKLSGGEHYLFIYLYFIFP